MINAKVAVYFLLAIVYKSILVYYVVFKRKGNLVFFIGISRIYLGVHFPSDVIGGFTAGGTWLAGCVIARHFVVYRRLNKPQVQ